VKAGIEPAELKLKCYGGLRHDRWILERCPAVSTSKRRKLLPSHGARRHSGRKTLADCRPLGFDRRMADELRRAGTEAFRYQLLDDHSRDPGIAQDRFEAGCIEENLLFWAVGSAFGGEWDGDDIKLHPGFDVRQLVALYHHLCAYPPIFRF
jgi:hypothetical protein